MKNRTFTFTREVPLGAEELPGVWEAKNGRGYRVPLNAYSSIGWRSPQRETALEGEVLTGLNNRLLNEDLREFAKEHQKRMLSKALAISGSHCWAPPGAGKTLVGLVYATTMAPTGVKLVITKAAARGTWAEQCERYTKLTPVLLTGQSAKAPKSKPDELYITAWETIKYWREAIIKLNPDVIIYDEIHWLRRPKHTKATVMQDGNIKYEGIGNSLDASRQIAQKADYKLALTATPIPGRVRDLWTQLDLVEPWQWGSFFQFGMRYCGGQHNGYGYEFNGLSNAHELKARLDYIKCRVTREEVNRHLPKKRREVVRLSIAQQNKPSAMKRELAKGAKLASSGGESERESYFETLLMEAASRKHKYVEDRVLDALKSGQKVTVFTGRRLDCDRLAKRLRKSTEDIQGLTVWDAHGGSDPTERDTIRNEYMSHPGPALLVGTGDAWGESVDLQDTDLAIISMLPWTPDKVIQWEGRFSRLGQKRPVLVSYVIARNTADEHVADLLLDKLPHVGEIAEDIAAEEIEGALGGIDESEGAASRLLDRITKVVSGIHSP
ncbi:MAG: DEAD/DEAH box helicase [Candidatus Bathyarchaeota archaeon]|nr:DEAD/DEAH box helicase [Candidatus Bathyarchaeota archaeon]